VVRSQTNGAWGPILAIYRLPQNSPLGPEEIERLVAAYEETFRALGLKDRNDPITEIVARKIFEIGQTGVRDPAQIAELALKELGTSNWPSSTGCGNY